MSEQNGHSTPSARLSAQAVAGGVSATTGLAIGGSVGALVGAVSLPYLVAAAQRTFDELTVRRRDNVIGLVAQASARMRVDPDEILVIADGSETGAALLAEAIQAAMATLDARKVAGLAKAVANGLIDDQAEVDMNLMIVRALADLEAPHVRLLGRLTSASSGVRLTNASLPMVAVLQRNGLAIDDAHERAVQAADERADATLKVVRDVLTSITKGKNVKLPAKVKRPTGTTSSRSAPRWRRTSFGSQCLHHLYEAAIETDLRPMDDRPQEDGNENHGAPGG